LSKQCKCGQNMNIRLRTVFYQNKVEIENVPVYSCEACNRNEVFPEVKPDLTGLIKQLGHQPGKQRLHFNELSELAHLIMKVTDKKQNQYPIELILIERINELLDLLLLARSLEDPVWVEDIRKRLTQITNHASEVLL
jgi:hypothetical protein